jgi:hypothetical protein
MATRASSKPPGDAQRLPRCNAERQGRRWRGSFRLVSRSDHWMLGPTRSATSSWTSRFWDASGSARPSTCRERSRPPMVRPRVSPVFGSFGTDRPIPTRCSCAEVCWRVVLTWISPSQPVSAVDTPSNRSSLVPTRANRRPARDTGSSRSSRVAAVSLRCLRWRNGRLVLSSCGPPR